MRTRHLLADLLTALGVLGAGVAVSVAAPPPDPGSVGPSSGRQVNGRVLAPLGKLVKLGNFPTGAAATPDGSFYWTVSTGRGVNDIRVVSVERGRSCRSSRFRGPRAAS